MAKIMRTITINAPIDKVFGYWEEPTNRLEVWPSFVEIKDVQPLPDGGKKFRWVYKMAGICLEGTNETSEYVANQRIVEKTEGGIKSTLTWICEPENGGTKMTSEVEYKVPVPVLGKLAEALIVKLNEREADTLMGNLKDRMEA